LPKSKSFRILAIWVGVNLLFLILQFLKLEILLLICTSFGGAYRKKKTFFQVFAGQE
jgi:hypothetical protein